MLPRVLLLEPHRGYVTYGNEPTHRHDWHELVVVLRGAYRCRIDGQPDLALPAGGAVLFPAQGAHRPECCHGRDLTLICVQWSGRLWTTTPVWAEDPSQRLALIASWLYDLHQRDDAPAVRSVLAGVLAELRWRAGREPLPADPVARLRRLLAMNLPARQHLPNLAALSGLSVSHLTRLYKARYGTTPMRDLRRMRLETALAMVRENQGTLQEIAQRCGLGRANYLARLVRRATGATALAVRGRARARRVR